MPTLNDLKERGDVPPRADKVSTKDKETLAENGTVFTITAVKHNPSGENGPYWTVSAECDGHPFQFDLQGHPSRDPQMAAIMSAAATEPVEGCILQELSERMGNKFLVIDSVGE